MTLAGKTRYAWPLRPEIELKIGRIQLADGYGVQVFQYSPRSRSAGPAVLYCHGIQSHPGWFTGSCQALAAAGCKVFAVARRGSGEATAQRGHARSAGQLLDDIDASLAYVRLSSGQDRPALVGVSWGGKLLTAWCLRGRTPPGVASLTLVAPGLAAQVDLSATAKLGVAMAAIFRPRKLYDIPLSDSALFTDNPDMRQYLTDDPCRLTCATARFLAVSACLDWTIARASAGSLTLPTTLLLARRERIIDNAATRAIIHRLTDGRAKVEELDACHTMDFEPDPTAFYARLTAAVVRR
jgi:acylglycerol lipase